MSPRKDEDKSEFMARCVPEMIGTGSDKRPQEQAVAICLDIWRSKDKSAKQVDQDNVPYPEPDETHEEFTDRCVDEVMSDDDTIDEGDAEDACELNWENRRAPDVVHKTHAETVQGMEFVLSDETPDRIGDIIMADGWDLQNFVKNPIALFNHIPSFIVGKWKGLRTDNGALRGYLELAPAGTSGRIDEIRKLVEAGILRAVSVGFRPLEHEPLDAKDPWSGSRFLKQELVETSLVSVPANPNALAVAKSLNISPATIDLVFAEHGKRDGIRRRGFTGGHAKTSRNGKDRAMTLAQRISDIQVQIVSTTDALNAHLDGQDDTNVSDADLEKTQDFNTKIAQLRKQHAALIESEKLLAGTGDANNGNGHSRALMTTTAFTQEAKGGSTAPAAPIIIPKRTKDLDPIELIVRAGTIAYHAKVSNRMPDQVREKIYGDDEPTRIVSDILLRASTAPAMTTVAGWAQELVHQIYADLMPLLMPNAVFTRLSAKGLTLSFGTAGKIVMPTRSRTPTLAGSFVGEGAAIPVRLGAFTSQTLTPKKMACITTWTREMQDHSTPAIEGVLREAVQQDTSVAIDTVLIDSNAATAIRPAGLLNGVSATTATAGGGLGAVVGDIKGLVGALTTGTFGNVRAPVWLMNPTDALSASLATAADTGIFPFKDEIGRGTLNNIPIIDSANVPAKTVILIDAADFVSVGGDAPRFEISDQATIHEEDTNPLPLVGPGSPGTVAAPQRSLFQTDSLALRLVLPLNWLQRRAGTVAWTQNVTW
jgi:HK97 family phage prohead protease